MLLALESASKVFADRVIFLRSTVKIEENDRIGVVGVNGAGKTTLLRVLSGDLALEEGERFARRNLQIGYLQQNSGVTESNTIQQEMRNAFAPLLEAKDKMASLASRMAEIAEKSDEQYVDIAAEYASLEAFYAANNGYTIDVQVETVLRGMGFGDWDRETICQTLSGGEKTRLALAKILLQNPDLLLLDEPTNYLDVTTLEWLENYLIGLKSALVVVSHDRYFLDRVCSKIWDVSCGEIESYRGNYTKYFQTREMVYERRVKEYEAQQDKIIKLSDYVARNKARASTANMAKSREKELETMEVIKQPPKALLPVKMRFSFEENPVKDVLDIKGLSLRAGGSPDGRELFTSLDLHITRGDRIAVVGKNGMGKSTLFHAILGNLTAAAGSVHWGMNVHTGWFEQEMTKLCSFHTVKEEFWNRYPRLSDQEVRAALARMRFGAEDLSKEIRTLSGGEKARLKFAILMLSQANVLILDEPTNHLDLLTREALDRALMEYEGTILAITHDRYLLHRMEWRVMELCEDGFKEYSGYDEYVAKRCGDDDAGFASKKAEKPKKEVVADAHYRGKRQRAEDAARRKRFGEVEREIEVLEQEESDLQTRMTDPEALRDYQQLEELSAQMENVRGAIEERMEEWASLEDLLKDSSM